MGVVPGAAILRAEGADAAVDVLAGRILTLIDAVPGLVVPKCPATGRTDESESGEEDQGARKCSSSKHLLEVTWRAVHPTLLIKGACGAIGGTERPAGHRRCGTASPLRLKPADVRRIGHVRCDECHVIHGVVHVSCCIRHFLHQEFRVACGEWRIECCEI